MTPARHEFSYRLFMMYLDLSELESVFEKRWFWSVKRSALARFRREDHLGDPAVSLDQSVRDLVEASSLKRPEGPIRLLTHLQYFGYCFNPVSFYYCFNAEDTRVDAIVAEVNNTPWGERHCYVLEGGETGPGHHQYSPAKEMHVSPFMPMQIDYDWRFKQPDERLTVHMSNSTDGDKVFDATLDLERVEISGFQLAWTLVTYPAMTARIIFAIHWQALKLWLKKVPVHDHPDKDKLATE